MANKATGPDSPAYLRGEARRRLGGDATDISDWSRTDTQSLVAELEVHQEELRIQNEALQQARNQLESARDRYRSLFEQAPVGYLLLDAEARIREANHPAAELLGADEPLIDQPLSAYVAAESQDTLHFLRRALAPDMAPRSDELTLAGAQESRRIAQVETLADPTTGPDAPHFRCALVDITRRRALETALQTERDRLKEHVTERTRELEAAQAHQERLLNSLAEGVFGIDPEGRFTFLNPAALRLFGYATANELLGRKSHPLTHHTDANGDPYPEAECPIYEVMATGEALPGWHETFWRADGSPFPVEVHASPLGDSASNQGAVVAFVDISERQAREHRLRQAATVFRQAQDGLMITDADTRILEVNPAVTRITGYTADELIGQTPGLLGSGHHGPDFYRALWAQVRETGSWSGEIWDRTRDGQLQAHWLTISAITDDQGETTNYIGVFSDISEIKRYQEAMEHRAFHDPLTDLPNRALFEDRLDHALDRARRNKGQLGVIFFDLDHFKDINDSLGHAVGDQLLQGVMERVSAALRQADTLAGRSQPDTLARVGGDEFTLLLEPVTDAKAALAAGQRIQEALAEPLEIEGQTFRGTASLGISVYPTDATTAEDLIRFADTALYQAKAAGRNAIQFYDAAQTEQAERRLDRGRRLEQALAADELVPFYQPQLDTETGALVGLEVLVRWDHPEEGLLGPDQFIPQAEELGQIHTLGTWVLKAACHQGRQWLAAGHDFGRLAVNISAGQVAEGDLAGQVAAALAESGLAGDRLELEITESTLMLATGTVQTALQAVRDLGVTLAVDDFGTGYSSLTYLQRLPVNRLKIDKAFVQDMLATPASYGIVRAILGLAHALELTVIAEGVETPAQEQALRREGAEVVQGFLYARPQPAAAVDFRAGSGKGPGHGE